MTLRGYAAHWLGTRTSRLTPNSVRLYSSALRNHLLPIFGEMELADLTQPVIRRWLTEQLAAGRAVNSIKSELAALCTVLTDAMIDGEVGQNAAHGAGRRLLPSRKTTTPPKAMTPHELDALLAASRLVPSRWAADAFYIYSRTGLRLGELLALQKRSCLFEDSAIRIDQTYHGGAMAFGPPKGGKARLVEVPARCLQVLRRHVEECHTPDAVLFPGADGHLPLHPGTVEAAFDQAASIAQIPQHFTVHSLRHTYASILITSGGDGVVPWVQQQLGHASYQITVDLYGSWLTRRRPDLLAVLDYLPARHGITRVERGIVIPLKQRR